MIKVNNLYKIFNKGKSNQINAVNNISIDFQKTGLVMLLGHSGSGKTTLLNTISGMDKPNSGEILIDSETFTKYNHNSWDKVRNKDMGFIFQHYNLLNDLTVYENLEFTLRILGITDQEEINNRIIYCLKAVGMQNYRRRKASALSGGQQQRVGIARAIAKNPKIIIADEPTGNLDSKNTIDIMNIIKKISKHTLVLMVTHDSKLADFYADRVIKLNDGAIISDYTNTSKNSYFNVSSDSDIYLKDLIKTTEDTKNININTYTENETLISPKIKFTLVNKNNTFYLQIDSPNQIVKIVDPNSEIKLIDKHYEDMKQSDVELSDFTFESFSNPTYKKSKSVISSKTAFKNSFKKVFGFKLLQKLFLLSLTFSAFLIAFSISSIFNIFNIDDKDFITVDRNYLSVETSDYTALTLDDFDKINAISSIDHINYYSESISFTVNLDTYIQTAYNPLYLSAHPIPTKDGSTKMFKGRFPSAPNEVAIDKFVLSNILYDNKGKLLEKAVDSGFLSYGQILDYPLAIDDKYTVVGITDTNSPSIYMDENEILKYNFPKQIKLNEYSSVPLNISLDYDDLIGQNKISIVEGGSVPQNSGEVLFPNSFLQTFNNTISLGDSYYDLTISGFYETLDVELNSNFTLITTEDLLEKNLFLNSKKILVYSNNIDKTKSELTKLNYKAINIYDEAYKLHKSDQVKGYTFLLIFSSIVFIVSLFEVYFLLRSSLMQRTREIGIYRALGIPRRDILKLFVFEIFIITSIFSVIGYAVASYIMYSIENTFGLGFFTISIWSLITGLIIIYSLNIISGLLPVHLLTRKTPAQILNKHDA